VAALVGATSACTLLTSLDGLTGGGTPGADEAGEVGASGDAASDSAFEGATEDASDGASDGAREGSAGEGGPITFVQTTGGSGNVDGGTSVTVPFQFAVADHHALVVCVDYFATATVAAVTDSLGNTFRTIAGPLDGQGIRNYIALAEDVRGGADQVTVALAGPYGRVIEVYLHEYAGFAAQDAFDVGAFNSGTDPKYDGGPTDGVTATLTTTGDNELLFGFVVTGGAHAGTGFTARSAFHANLTEDRQLGGRGTSTATATVYAGTTWTMVAAAFRGQ
jgi:hypothetical protein